MRSARLQAILLAVGLSAGVAASAAPRWQRIDDGDPPPPSSDFVYWDASTSHIRVISVLGTDNGNANFARPPTVWELWGDDWRRVAFPEPSPTKVRACVSYDTVRHVLVVFGGLYADETWEFDGTQWALRNPVTRPPTRAFCAMAFDENRNKTVMFGGFDSSGVPRSGTWEWDGTNWTLRSLMVNPAARARHRMVYDPDRRVVLLFGGQQGVGPTYYNDTWEFNGTAWTKRNPSNPPPLRAEHALAYDRVRHRAIVFGGFDNNGQLLGDTWEWNGNQWTSVSPTVSPPPGWGMRTAFDPSRNAIVAQGEELEGLGASNVTWSYNGTTWTKIAVSGLPQGRRNFGMAYDPLIDRVVMHGGSSNFQPGGIYISDTWLFNGAAWIRDLSSPQPTAQLGIPLAFDDATGGIVGFGGGPPSGQLSDDVHRYAGSTPGWTSGSDCCPGPLPRENSGLAYAPSLSGSVLFGGWACCFAGGNFAANDTWILSGNSWVEQAPATVPQGRLDHALTYDSLRQRVLLYGGSWRAALDSELADMWSFDGTDWTELSAAAAPGPRYGVSLAYDSARDRVVLFGDGEPSEAVTWEFDGANWAAIPTPFLPDPDRCHMQMAYDSKREVIWLFGGTACDSDLYFNDTWAYGPDPDDDGIVGKLDNCTQIANANQVNADADVAGDACDCAPSDPGSFAIPIESGGLAVSGKVDSLVTWTDQKPASGSGTTYQLVSGGLAALRASGSFVGSSCVSNGSGTPSYTDSRPVPSADGFWYLVRAKNVCGAGTFGSAGLDAAPPCP